tara:strand:- start:437 stop:1495 length:1059 start_codon:yes stop_codon:yes gene_type:complete
MLNEHDYLQKKFQDGTFFKMICGAGNEDAELVKKLAFVYTLAGATMLDISANPKIVEAALAGINLAIDFAENEGLEKPEKPFITVSIGMPGDPHVRKAFIENDPCIGCGLCIPVCPTVAIPLNLRDLWKNDETIIIESLCIGCGKCSSVCPKPDVITYSHKQEHLEEIIPKCLAAGANFVELHAGIPDEEQTLKEWELVCKLNPGKFNSICLDRTNLSNMALEGRVAAAHELAGGCLIVQADGYPMSGGEDDYNTTLQAVSCADVINKKFNYPYVKKRKALHIPIILSGGTNSLTKELADTAGVPINGVAIGTFARDIITEEVETLGFLHNRELILSSVGKAKELITKNINE